MEEKDVDLFMEARKSLAVAFCVLQVQSYCLTSALAPSVGQTGVQTGSGDSSRR